MKIKTILVIFMFVLIFTISSLADFSTTKGFEWLIGQSRDGSFNDNIIDTSIATLALSSIGSSEAENSYNWLLTQENSLYCWPKANCKVKDTAFALLALNSLNKDISNISSWLRNAQTPTLLNGNFWLQIITSEDGSCKVLYKKDSQTIEKNITIINGKFTGCNNNTWFDLNSCLESNLLSNYPGLKLNVNCNALTTTPRISLIFNSANTYYLIHDIQSSSTEITVPNNCFGTSYRDSCSDDATLYASFALKETQQDFIPIIYLLQNYDQSSIEQNSILYLIFNRDIYLNKLISMQKVDGSFDNDVYKTAIAVLALKESQEQTALNNAIEFLKSKQKDDGSWDNVLNTAFALYAAFTGGQLPTCFNGETRLCSNQKGVCEDSIEICTERIWPGCNLTSIQFYEQRETTCNDSLDNDCDGLDDVNDNDCGGGRVSCNFDDICDEPFEDSDTCPEDCPIGLGLCSNNAQDIDNNEEGIDCGGPCPEDCPEAVCNADGICEWEIYHENVNECPDDCSCGDTECDEYEKYHGTCPQDCEPVTVECTIDEDCAADEICQNGECISSLPPEKGKFPYWIITLLLIVAIGGYIYYIKIFKKQKFNILTIFKKINIFKKKPKTKIPIQQSLPPKKPIIPPQYPYKAREEKSQIEKELERSIEEARKLIGKK